MIQITELFTTPILNTYFPLEKSLDKYVIDYCKKNKTETKSNINGYQSNNILEKPNSRISSFIDSLTSPVKVFSSSLRLKQSIQLNNMWFNINKPGATNKLHNHPQSIISGVYYLKVPKDSGNIIFYNPASELMSSYLPNSFVNSYDRYNANSWSITPKENYLILFPSWLRHEVSKNDSKKDRISIAFNYSFK